MGSRAAKRASLVELVEMAEPLLRRAERECPRRGPGRRPTIPDWVLGALIMVAILKRRKSKSSQYRFLDQHRSELQKWLGIDKFPARSTYFDRYRRAHRLFQLAIKLQGRRALTERVADARSVTVDKSLIESLGPAWHRSQRIRGVVPRGVDRDSTWSYSEHHGWVQGYGFEVVVTAGKNGVVLPLLASVDTASLRESRTFLTKIAALPAATKHVLADSGYDTNDIADAIEWRANGKPSGCRFLCRHVRKRKAKQCWRETHRRSARRVRREARAKYFRTATARRLYRRRGKTVEPFNQWFKNLFDLSDQVWHRGLDNNRTQILAAIFCYQLLLRHNRRRRAKHAQIQWALDGL